MSKPNQDRIPTGGPQAGLNSAIAGLLGGLDISALPEAPQSPGRAPAPSAVSKKGRVILRREKAHRGGVTVIIVHDFPPHVADAAIEEISRKLRKTCGCGGTVRNREIQVQGDQPAKIREILESEGFRVGGI
jgi:translation initiation factor 1